VRRLTAIVLMAACAAAQAARVESVSPQGEVREVRQAVVRYGAPVRPLGDLRGPDPYTIACNGPAPTGQGRWADERTWLYDFKEALPPGVRCTATPRPETTRQLPATVSDSTRMWKQSPAATASRGAASATAAGCPGS